MLRLSVEWDLTIWCWLNNNIQGGIRVCERNYALQLFQLAVKEHQL